MSSLYHEGSRSLQQRFDTTRLADRIEEVKVTDVISESDRAFIEARDMFFLATADEEGRPQCSYKGGGPGFVRVLDEHTIAFPSYDGNGMYLSAGNMLVNPEVGLLFVDFEGHANDPHVKDALKALAKHCAVLSVLGSYPKASGV